MTGLPAPSTDTIEGDVVMAKDAPRPIRSPKAGRPTGPRTGKPAARRRQKTARAAVRKDTMLQQAPEGPRILWGRAKPQVKKG